jgi:galactofuranose transport system substrate-binding protein
MNSSRTLNQFLATGLIALAVISAPAAKAQEMSPAVKAVIDFDRGFTGPIKKYRIGYLTECVNNPYCQARLEGMKAAAKKYGFEFKIFDADFNPATQAKLVQNAVTEGFDGYVFGPASAQSGCSLFRGLIKPTGAPVATVAIPMCGNPDHTPGLAATLSMNTPAYYKKMIDGAFSTCAKPCEVVALGGYVGTDLFNYWQQALEQGVKDHPNVKLVMNEPGNFDPREGLQKTQDALLAHPAVSMIVTSWDDMTRGAERAVAAAGKTPGADVRIFSAGATRIGIEKILSGSWNSSMAFLPYQEAYYAAVAVVMALEGKPVNAYVDEGLLPEILNTTGTVFITKDNAGRYKADY